MKTLLTGSRHFVALAAVHEYAERGYQVYTADSVNFDYTKYSRVVRVAFRVPSVRFNEAGYIDSLVTIIKNEHIDVVVPLGEEAFILARNIEALLRANPKLELKTGTFEQLELLHNKDAFTRMADAARLLVPKSRVVTSVDEIIAFQKQYTPHVILKPLYSRFGRQLVELHSIGDRELLALDGESAKKFSGKLSEKNKYLVQEYIEGESFSSFSTDPKSEVITYKSAVTIRHKSAMPVVRKVRTPDEVAAADVALRESAGYIGQLGLDYIRTPSGQLYVIEANPRATIGYLLQYKKHVQTRLMMFYYFLNGYVAPRALLQFLWVFITYPDGLFRWRDMLPAVASQVVGIKEYVRFQKEHPESDFRDYTSYDMEYNGRVEFTSQAAVDADSDAMLELLEAMPTKGALNMVYTRRPNAISSFQSDGEKVAVELIKDEQERIAYMSVCAENAYYLNGKATKMGYISALRKNFAFPYRIAWFDLFFEGYKKVLSTTYYFCSVISTNAHAIQVITKHYPGRPQFKQIGAYTLYVANTKRVAAPPLSAGVHFLRADKVPISAVEEFLKHEGAKRALFPVATKLHSNTFGITEKNSYVLTRGEEIIAFAGVVDQRAKKQFIITRYAWYMRPFRLLNPLFKMLRLMSLPRQGEAVNCPAVTHLLVKDDDATLHAAFMGNLANEIDKQAALFMVALSSKSPHRRQFETAYTMKLNNNLYGMSVHDEPLDIDAEQLHIDALLLY